VLYPEKYTLLVPLASENALQRCGNLPSSALKRRDDIGLHDVFSLLCKFALVRLGALYFGSTGSHEEEWL
jgi:hypothetical protein